MAQHVFAACRLRMSTRQIAICDCCIERASLMTPEHFKKIAVERTPSVPLHVESTLHRHDVIRSLKGNDNIGIELGVASGGFSKRMIESGKFKMFYGVDIYSDHHDTDEYVRALMHVGLETNYKLLRMSFDDALPLFEDGYFDFIYFDGYAHTGEEGGKAFADWYRKVKVGGTLAGDDYHDDWPLVKWAVNTFVKALDAQLSLTGLTEKTDDYMSNYPSWFFTKARDFEFTGPLDAELFAIGQQARAAGLVPPAAAQPIGPGVTLTLQQILDFCDLLCQRHPEKVPELRRIISRHAA